MEKTEQEKLREIYNSQFKPKYDSKNYSEATKLLTENPGLDNYLTNQELTGLATCLLQEQNSTLKEINSTLKKTLGKLGY